VEVHYDIAGCGSDYRWDFGIVEARPVMERIQVRRQPGHRWGIWVDDVLVEGGFHYHDTAEARAMDYVGELTN
jgi:hypothetical protein